MNKWCAIAVLAISAFAASAQAEVIVRFIVAVDAAAQSFDIFVEDLAPVATASGQLGNGGISGFSISFDQDSATRNTIVIETLDIARISGLNSGFQDTGFEFDSSGDGHNLDPNDPTKTAPNMFAIQRSSLELVYEFGQTPGVIPNIDFGVPGSADGPIPFDRPALIGSGTYSGTLPLDGLGNPTFPVQAIGASVFSFVGAPSDGDTVTNLLSNELELLIVVPEPASFAMFVVGAGLMLTGRKRETR